MKKDIKSIIKKHSVFFEQQNGLKIWNLPKAKWNDVAQDISNLPAVSEKEFPNGFSSWQETHFEIVSAITKEVENGVPDGTVTKRLEQQGTGGLYELSEELTDKFEKLHEGREWDGEFFDEMESFLEKEL